VRRCGYKRKDFPSPMPYEADCSPGKKRDTQPFPSNLNGLSRSMLTPESPRQTVDKKPPPRRKRLRTHIHFFPAWSATTPHNKDCRSVRS
jgi:hypothetical protein